MEIMNISEKLSGIRRTISIRFGIVGRLFQFLWQNKMWWLIPMVALIVVFFLIIIFAQSSPLGPFIYTIF
ncbi:MAG: DUF5989 family protein [Patescibacteria group bacterium]